MAGAAPSKGNSIPGGERERRQGGEQEGTLQGGQEGYSRPDVGGAETMVSDLMMQGQWWCLLRACLSGLWSLRAFVKKG